MEVEEHAVERRQEHPIGNGPEDRPGARLTVLQRLVGAALLDGDAGDVGGDVISRCSASRGARGCA